MINGGDGGLTIGDVEMKQFELLNENEPFVSKESAERFVKIVVNSHYGLNPENKVRGEFQITESDDKFYIWYRPLE